MNCIKCGREIPDGELFCRECSRMPEPPEPARSRLQAKPQPKQPQKPQRPSPECKPQRHTSAARQEAPRRGSRKLIAALVIVCLLLAASLALD